MNGNNSVTDSPGPGQAHRVVTPEAITAVVAIVKENRRITVNEIAAHLDMSHGSAHHMSIMFCSSTKCLQGGSHAN